MIRGIFFDAAGVFYDRKETTGTFARRRLVELGYPPELSKENNARKKELHLLATEGRLSHETYWDQVLALHRVDDLTLRAKLRKEILDHTFDVFAYPGGKEAMAGLEARGYVLGIITDTVYPVEWKMAWLEKVGVAQFIRVVACSSTLGAHKPEPEMYLNALEQAGLKPAQAAFVGHDAGELEGARQAGLVTVAVNYDPEAKADYYASSLAGLLDLPIFRPLQVHVESL
ncbi:MAG: HAD family hydrolase [Acidobacteriota bacterium]